MLKGIVPAAPPNGGNSVISSEVFSFEQGFRKARTVSIKYVMQGNECYEVNKQYYKVGKGSFLLMNEGADYAIQVKGQQVNQGLCVYLNPEYLQQGQYYLCEKESALLDNPFPYRTTEIDIFEGLYSSGDLGINRVLDTLSKRINEGGTIDGFSEEDYLQIAEQLIISQQNVSQTISSLSAKKPSVQKELYKRAHQAKIFLDDSLFHPVSIDALAQLVQMSQFHFQRIFKEVFHISPYQYLIGERLKKAYTMLHENQHSITSIALMLCFSDVHSFSKSFKQKYSCSPRQVIFF